MQLMTESHQLLCVQPFNMAIIKVYVPTTEVEQKVCGRVCMSCMVKFNLRLAKYESKIYCLWLGTGIPKLEILRRKIYTLAVQTQKLKQSQMMVYPFLPIPFLTQISKCKWCLYIWTSSDKNQIDYIIGRRRWKSSVIIAKTGLEPVCGTDYKLLICKIR